MSKPDKIEIRKSSTDATIFTLSVVSESEAVLVATVDETSDTPITLSKMPDGTLQTFDGVSYDILRRLIDVTPNFTALYATFKRDAVYAIDAYADEAKEDGHHTAMSNRLCDALVCLNVMAQSIADTAMLQAFREDIADLVVTMNKARGV